MVLGGWWLGVAVTKPIRTTGCLGLSTPTGCLGLPTGREEKVVLLEGSQGGLCRHKQTEGYSSIVKTIQQYKHTHTYTKEGRGLTSIIIVGRMHNKFLNISFLSMTWTKMVAYYLQQQQKLLSKKGVVFFFPKAHPEDVPLTKRKPLCTPPTEECRVAA